MPGTGIYEDRESTIKGLESFLSKYDDEIPAETGPKKASGIGKVIDEAKETAKAVIENVKRPAKELKVKQKLQAKKAAKYIKTMQELKK